jgi:hypothetical protein
MSGAAVSDRTEQVIKWGQEDTDQGTNLFVKKGYLLFRLLYFQLSSSSAMISQASQEELKRRRRDQISGYAV